MKLAINVACPKCGWFGNHPHDIGTHAPCDVCPICRPWTCLPLAAPAFHETHPVQYNNTIGPGSLVYTSGLWCKGVVLKKGSNSRFARVRWDSGLVSYHEVSSLYRITSLYQGYYATVSESELLGGNVLP